MLAFSRPLSGAEWSAVPPGDREREARAFHERVLRLFRKGIAIRCPVVAKVSPTPGGLKVERFRDARAQDQGLLQLLEANGDCLRRCRHCGAWFWRDRKREYCGPCFQSGTARSKVHRAKARAARAVPVRGSEGEDHHKNATVASRRSERPAEVAAPTGVRCAVAKGHNDEGHGDREGNEEQ